MNNIAVKIKMIRILILLVFNDNKVSRLIDVLRDDKICCIG